MYPTETVITLDGKQVSYPGLINGKFSDGDWNDPAKPPSAVPAATLNLLLDSLSKVITDAGVPMSNTDSGIFRRALNVLLKKEFPIGSMMMFDANSVSSRFPATDILVGKRYKIASVGTTNFLTIGSGSNAVGSIFTATASGVGTGMVTSELGISGQWQDDVTMPGWFACVATNAVMGCPNMVDRFVMGKVVAGSSATGGANTHVISSANLPLHTHSIDHNHGAVTTGVESAGHTHTGTTGGDSPDHTHSTAGSNSVSGGGGYGCAGFNVGSVSYYGTSGASARHQHSFASNGASAQHNHSLSIPAFTGESDNGGFTNTAIDHRPAYYSIIYIRKCTQGAS